MQGLQSLHTGLPVPDIPTWENPNRKGVVLPELDRPERCTNCRLMHLYGRTLCGMCQMICPDQAIRWEEEKPNEPHKVAIEY